MHTRYRLDRRAQHECAPHPHRHLKASGAETSFHDSESVQFSRTSCSSSSLAHFQRGQNTRYRIPQWLITKIRTLCCESVCKQIWVNNDELILPPGHHYLCQSTRSVPPEAPQ